MKDLTNDPEFLAFVDARRDPMGFATLNTFAAAWEKGSARPVALALAALGFTHYLKKGTRNVFGLRSTAQPKEPARSSDDMAVNEALRWFARAERSGALRLGPEISVVAAEISRYAGIDVDVRAVREAASMAHVIISPGPTAKVGLLAPWFDYVRRVPDDAARSFSVALSAR